MDIYHYDMISNDTMLTLYESKNVQFWIFLSSINDYLIFPLKYHLTFHERLRKLIKLMITNLCIYFLSTRRHKFKRKKLIYSVTKIKVRLNVMLQFLLKYRICKSGFAEIITLIFYFFS